MACESFYTLGPKLVQGSQSAGGAGILFATTNDTAAYFQFVVENGFATCPDLVAALPLYYALPAAAFLEENVYSIPQPVAANWSFEDSADGGYTVNVNVNGVDQGFFTVTQSLGVVSIDLSSCTATWPILVGGSSPNGRNVGFQVNSFGTLWKGEFNLPSAIVAMQDEWVSCAVPACALPGTSYCIINPPVAVSNYTFSSTPGAIIK